MICGGYKYATNSRHHTHSTHSSLIRRSLDGMGKSSLIIRALFLAAVAAAASANFLTEVEFNWGDGRGKILNGGDLLELSLDRVSGSGFQSKKEYLFGRFDMRMKLVAGNSAGTVATYYLSSLGPTHDEIDFEFLGNLSNQPYVLHTNVYAHGKGDREQQFYLWFDPRLAFHTYSVLWNPLETVFYVDGTPIRVFRNLESNGVPYLKSQPMRLYASLWDGDDWATRGGLEKTDWSKAPFIASYQGFVADACVATPGRQPACSASRANWWNQRLDSVAAQKLKAVRDRYMIYDYCKDTKRYPNGFPAECAMPLV